MKFEFVIGQRWMSETEPELGLGVVLKVEQKTVTIAFSGSEGMRTYGRQTAPLKRVIFDVGDSIKLQTQETIEVDEVVENAGLVTYLGQGIQVAEAQLSDTINFSKPEEKLFNGQVDSPGLFALRYETLRRNEKYAKSSARGFLGGRVSLIPHQFYVAQEIASRGLPRVLLADEVGLGKTIEAGLIIHRLLSIEKIHNVLVVVPDTLVFQWLLEMKRRFFLEFSVITDKESFHRDILREDENPFQESQLIITSASLLVDSEIARQRCKKTDWDMVVIDEAHRLEWSREVSSPAYDALEEICQISPGLLLLSATPEQLGQEGHFARLKLLDPNRFSDFEKFQNEAKAYGQLASEVDSILKGRNYKELDDNTKMTIQDLLDQHGTGRVYFRNTRKNMAANFDFFPKRILHAQPLSLEGEMEGLKKNYLEEKSLLTKLNWLVSLIKSCRGAKLLLICKDKKIVQRIEKEILSMMNLKLALFHEDLSLMARDRNAAYFADPDGAQVLLCTEIGSEGRNFEFAHNLVLFDLPHHPDLLEQRIGRLDRIGQKADINIYVPYMKTTSEEILFSYYNEGMNAFTQSFSGGGQVFDLTADELEKSIKKKFFSNENELKSTLAPLLEKTKEAFTNISQALDEGRDKLIEINSFDEQKSQELLKNIREMSKDQGLVEYLDKVFEHLGVDNEELNALSFYAKPGDNMFIPVFPGLSAQGLSYTFDRAQALEREDLSFMTWDHPLVRGVSDLIMSQPLGNFSVSSWTRPQNKLLFECVYIFSCVANKENIIGQFFPPTAIRIVLDFNGQNVTANYPWKKLNSLVEGPNKDKLENLSQIPKESVKKVLALGKAHAQKKSQVLGDKILEDVTQFFNREIDRMMALKKKNPTVREEEIVWLVNKKEAVGKIIGKADIRLDSFRLIF